MVWIVWMVWILASAALKGPNSFSFARLWLIANGV